MNPRLSGLACLYVLLAASPATAAEVSPLIDVNPDVDRSLVEPANNKTWGYSFYVTSPVKVTHVAWYDTHRDGLSHSHQVGIWKDTTGLTTWPYMPQDGSGTLLFSTTIPAGTSAELSGPWRRVRVQFPIGLTLGVGGYSIGGQNNAQSQDDMVYLFDPPASVIDPRVKLGSFDFNMNGPDGFHPPGSPPSGWYALTGAELGPMLFVEAVPEPSGTALAFGCVLATLSRRRQRTNSRQGK
jgi:hypothetical protein